MHLIRVQALLVFLSSLAATGCEQRDPGLAGDSTGTVAGTTGAMAGAGGSAAIGAAGSTNAVAGRVAISGSGSPPDVSVAGAGGTAAGGSAAAAAGSGGPGPGAVASNGSLFPIKPGNTWSFRTTKGSEVGNKTQTVGALEMVGGTGPKSATMAYKMVTMKDDGMDKTESWQAELGGKVVRYRERAYATGGGSVELEEHWDPYKLRIDGTQLTVGSTYTEQYRETKIMTDGAPATANSMDTWKVVSVNEMVTVPAGTFTAVVIEKVGGTSTKRYWFARGVGKVREQSGSQIEELTSYMVTP